LASAAGHDANQLTCFGSLNCFMLGFVELFPLASFHAPLLVRTNLCETQASQVSQQALAQMLASSGDGVLVRIRNHTAGNSLHQPEQLDKNSGVETSAKDLTWSYATILKAMKQREHTMHAIASAAGSH
jgi:hypothetical protein